MSIGLLFVPTWNRSDSKYGSDWRAMFSIMVALIGGLFLLFLSYSMGLLILRLTGIYISLTMKVLS